MKHEISVQHGALACAFSGEGELPLEELSVGAMTIQTDRAWDQTVRSGSEELTRATISLSPSQWWGFGKDDPQPDFVR